MTMQLLRHVAYQSAGEVFPLIFQGLRCGLSKNDSELAEPDTELRITGVTLPMFDAIFCDKEAQGESIIDSTIERPPDDGFERLFVSGIFHFAYIPFCAVGLQPKELFFE